MTEKKDVPYIVYEDTATRLERTIERLWILAIILVALLIGTNGAWLYYEHQFEDTVITQEVKQDSGDGGMNTYSGNVIGGDYNGTTDDSDNNSETN